MKKIGIVLLVSALSMTGCKKESTTLKDTIESYSLSDFMDTRVTENTASRSNTISPKSNLKAIIRKVANTTDKYRLVLKVDSVEIENKDPKTGEIKLQMVDIETLEDLKITAGLSLTDPFNPDKETVFFTKESMQFTKQNENGFFVYVSAPFAGPSGTTDESNGFAYELVNISYSLVAPGKPTIIVGADIDEKALVFILPNGKAIEQDPMVEKALAYSTTTGEIKDIEITISGDPAQEVETLKFVPDPILKDPKDPKSVIQFPSVLFTKTQFSQNTGIAKFKVNDRIVWTQGHDVRGKVYGNGKGGKVNMEFMVEDFRYKVDHK
jgi:hypothetical protein